MDRKAAVRRLFEDAYNEGDFTVARDLIADDLDLHTPLQLDSEPLKGRDGFERLITWVRSAWSDVHVEVHDVFGEDESVALRLTFTGVHTGPLFAYRSSGRRGTWTELVICDFSDGRIVRIWHELNRLHILQEIGAMPDEWEMGRPPKAIIAVMRARGRLQRRLAARRAA